MSLQAAAAEAVTGTEVVSVPLGPDDVDVEVLPVTDWRPRHLKALSSGDFDDWAEGCLTDAGHDAWTQVDPTIGEIEAFFTAWTERTGQDPGKSRASRRSAKSTARR